MMDQPELLFNWTDDGDKYGLFSAMPGLGFGIIRSRVDEFQIKDYRISLASGSRSLSYGIGFGWSSGDKALFARENVYTMGLIYRPMSKMSIGLASSISDKGDKEAILDLGLRPFGDDRFSLFGDFMINKTGDENDDRWSAGFSAKIVQGLMLTGRYISDKRVTVGMQFSFGRVGVGGLGSFDDDSNHERNTYSIRFGAEENNILSNISKPQNYLSLNMHGNIRYRKYRYFDNTTTLFELLSLIEKAKTDDTIKGIAINTSGMNISAQMIWELRAKLKDFKESGKTIIIYIDRVNISGYHLASVADKIVMDPWGNIILEGYAYSNTYLKNFLDKIGIGINEFRLFDYKSMAEALSRDSMSNHEREQSQRMVDMFYEAIRHEISESRNFTHEQFDTMVNEIAMFTPQKALEHGLIDSIARFEKISDLIEEFFDTKPDMLNSDRYTASEVIDDKWGPKPEIAIVYALGPTSMDSGINARTLHRQIRRLKNSPNVKAIILRVDSPGGDGLASDLVADAIKECKGVKPIIISQGYLAASGGYWISMDGDVIVTSPKTITGSIGVAGLFMYDKEFSNKTGLTYDFVKRGRSADLGRGTTLPLLNLTIPARNVTEDEQETIHNYMHSAYEMFVQSVADARDMSYKETEQVSRGRIWIGQDAIDMGLADELGGLETAIEIALEKLGLDRSDVVINEYPKMPAFNLSQMLNLNLNLFGIRFQSQDISDPMIQDLIFRLKYNGIPVPMISLDYYGDYLEYIY